MKTAKEYKALLLGQHHEGKAALADIDRVIAWWANGERFDIVQATRLYRHHGPEYCALLELLNEDLPHVPKQNVCAEVQNGRVVYFLERSDFFGRFIDREEITEAQAIYLEEVKTA